DVVDAGAGNVGQVVEADSAARLESSAAASLRDGCGHLLGREVIEEDQRRAGLERFVELLQAGHFDLDDLAGGRAALGGVHGRRDPAGGADVVLLDQETVVETGAVVTGATDTDGVLLEHAQAGRGLARVDHPGAGTGNQLRGTPAGGGDTRQPLEEV